MISFTIYCDNCENPVEVLDVDKDDGALYVAVCRKCWREAYEEGFRSGWYECVLHYGINECGDDEQEEE